MPDPFRVGHHFLVIVELITVAAIAMLHVAGMKADSPAVEALNPPATVADPVSGHHCATRIRF